MLFLQQAFQVSVFYGHPYFTFRVAGNLVRGIDEGNAVFSNDEVVWRVGIDAIEYCLFTQAFNAVDVVFVAQSLYYQIGQFLVISGNEQVF